VSGSASNAKVRRDQDLTHPVIAVRVGTPSTRRVRSCTDVPVSVFFLASTVTVSYKVNRLGTVSVSPVQQTLV